MRLRVGHTRRPRPAFDSPPREIREIRMKPPSLTRACRFTKMRSRCGWRPRCCGHNGLSTARSLCGESALITVCLSVRSVWLPAVRPQAHFPTHVRAALHLRPLPQALGHAAVCALTEESRPMTLDIPLICGAFVEPDNSGAVYASVRCNRDIRSWPCHPAVPHLWWRRPRAAIGSPNNDRSFVLLDV